MITTLPGLYSVSWIAITVLERDLSATGLLTQKGPDSVLCSTPYLRGQNVLFLVALFVLLYKVIAIDDVHEQSIISMLVFPFTEYTVYTLYSSLIHGL